MRYKCKYILFFSVYKAQFPVTIADTLKTDDGKSVAGGVLFGVALALGFFAFLKTYGKFEIYFDIIVNVFET